MTSKFLLALLFFSPTAETTILTENFVKPIQSVYVDEGPTYEELYEEALFDCPHIKEASKKKERIIEQLIAVEKSFNPPPGVRGMLLAAACMESGYNPNAKGDRKFSKNKKTPKAIGILQLWPIYEKMFPGLDRTDPKSSAISWMKHIIKQIPKIKKTCRYRTDARIWLAAWVTGIRYKKKTGRCGEKPSHYRLLKRWHRNIKRDRKITGCAGQDGCSC